MNPYKGVGISQGKISWNTPPWLEIEPWPHGEQTGRCPTELSWPRPQRGQTGRYPTELSWPRPQRGQTGSYPTELSWPRPQRGQTGRYPTELSWPRPQRGQTGSYPTELLWPRLQRGQTERPSFSHWATMNDLKSYTDSCIRRSYCNLENYSCDIWLNIRNAQLSSLNADLPEIIGTNCCNMFHINNLATLNDKEIHGWRQTIA